MSRRDKRPRTRDIVLIGASQGGFEAVVALLATMPAGLNAAIAVTVHRSPLPSLLAELLSRHIKLKVVEPFHGQLFLQQCVYLAPADHHLLLSSGALWLDRGPREHHTRPAIDVMFRSGAEEYGNRVIGVLLTGNLNDGTAGLIRIKSKGGLSLAQDPTEALAPSMPQNAIRYDNVDVVFKLEQGCSLLRRLVAGAELEEIITADRTPRAGPTAARPRLPPQEPRSRGSSLSRAPAAAKTGLASTSASPGPASGGRSFSTSGPAESCRSPSSARGRCARHSRSTSAPWPCR